MQGDIKAICSKFCKQRSFMCVSWLLPMLKSSHFIFFLFPCNPCLVINITSPETIIPDTFFFVNGSAQRDNYFQKKKSNKLKSEKVERGPWTTKCYQARIGNSAISKLPNCHIRYFCNFCLLPCHFLVCGAVKFASFGIFVILASAHFGLAVNILASFAIFEAWLEPPFLVYP